MIIPIRRSRRERLTRAAIRMGRHPAVWKRARGVVIRKPGKDDNTKLKAYRCLTAGENWLRK